MSNFFYIVAVVLIITWAIGFFALHVGGMIHFLLVFAAVAILFRVSSIKEAL